MRIAFLTNEFKMQGLPSGGLGAYINRVTRTLSELGHQPEIFVVSKKDHGTSVLNGVVVHTVKVITADTFIRKSVNWILFRIFRELWAGPAGYINNAWHLSRDLSAREKQVKFDFVQSTNCGGCGLMIRKKKNRPHVMRLSSKRDLVLDSDGKRGPGFTLMSCLEKLSAARADIVYAPSRFIAQECIEKWRVPTKVLRPPVFLETQPARQIPFSLPARFMVHTGTFSVKKGSIVLARALQTVWEHAPDFEMVWCGSFDDQTTCADCCALFGAHAPKIRLVGALHKNVLYAVIQKSIAVVLPSLADNLPNAAIESLLLSTPVIGTYDSSIDELVQDGVTGLLVAKQSERELAEALLAAWNKKTAFNMDAVTTHSVFAEMNPETAVNNLVNFNFGE